MIKPKKTYYDVNNDKLGSGVYLAKYLSGDYIGSSATLERRRMCHMKGQAAIGRRTYQKSHSFEVLLNCHPSRLRELERKMILWVGIENLLNTHVPRVPTKEIENE